MRRLPSFVTIILQNFLDEFCKTSKVKYNNELTLISSTQRDLQDDGF